jgi:competence protein ComEC
MKLENLLTVILASATLVGFVAGYLRTEPTEVIFLSVGQGDSALLQAEGVDFLVDDGPVVNGADAGELLVVPKLRQYGVSCLSVIFLTHPDGDHIGGTGAVLRRFPSARLAINSVFRQNPAIVDSLKAWRVQDKDVIWLNGETRWRFGTATLTIYAPPTAPDTNEGSLFLHFLDRGAKAVLSGDAPSDSEERAAAIDDWSSDVMKAGHHGSRTSTSDAWLREVHPHDAVISCGIDNPYGHPHKETLDRLQEAGVQVHRTDKEGDIVFKEQAGQFVYQP